MRLSVFYDTNNGMIEPTYERLKKWEQNDHLVNFGSCYNAGENTKL